MRTSAAAAFLLDLGRSRSKRGTATTAALLDRLDVRPADVDYVQVAGSNGKGSTAHMTAHVLREAGLDVGLYTSPHITDVTDRIRVNGRPITGADLAAAVEAVRPAVESLAADGDEPTFFETLTAIAIRHFERRGVDVAVLEVGIGGRYDATSVVDPVAAAVTTVSLEHTEVLGDTVESIARDKARVAPADSPLVTAASGAALDALREFTSVRTVGGPDADVRVEATGLTADRHTAVTLSGPDWTVRTRLSLVGPHQAANAGIAATLARQVADPDPGAIADGLEAASLPGRFEVVDDRPLTVLDGAHNPSACRALAATLDEFAYDDLHLVFGALADKDVDAMAAALPDPDRVYACRPPVGRAADPSAVGAAFDDAETDVETVPRVEAAVDRAQRTAGPDDCILVAGSLYGVAAARTHLLDRDVAATGPVSGGDEAD